MTTFQALDRIGIHRQKAGMKHWLLPIAFIASSCATPAEATDDPVSAGPVIAAERAFAARHQSVSVKQAFTEFAAPDGVALTAEGTKNVQAFIATWPDRGDKGFIVWWPDFAGIARSGDLGFTTGPASFGGGGRYSDYFTVWKKQPDGSWKWLIDQGTKRGAKPAGGPDGPVAIVDAAAPQELDARREKLRLFAVDDREGGVRLSDFAPEARLLGWRDEPVNGRGAIAAARTGRNDLETEQDGGGVSAAGDLGWTYGYVGWTEAGQPKRGPYLRVWQRRDDGWKILVESIGTF
ncbi:MAG: nuclear transport factor 2 family protein [Allosphingosinicella sp.]